jgi:carbon starvation protein CstA
VRSTFAVLRLATAGLIVAAVVAQLIRSIGNTLAAEGDVSALLVNFFSFFTIESNVLAAVAMLLGVVSVLTAKGAEKEWFTTLRLVATTYMTVTLVVYNLLLRNVELPQGQTVAWSNEILHVLGPLLVILDWLLAPGRNRLEWRRVWVVVIFPVLWAAYTLIRGPIVGWYPYPFLNPDESQNGYLSVSFYVILISAIMLGVGAAAIWVSRQRERWPLPAAK